MPDYMIIFLFVFLATTLGIVIVCSVIKGSRRAGRLFYWILAPSVFLSVVFTILFTPEERKPKYSIAGFKESRPQYDSSGMALPSEKVVYSLAELKKMSKTGLMPPLGKPRIETKEYAFDRCLAQASMLRSTTRQFMPSETLVSTDIHYEIRIWSVDGVILIKCIGAESAMTVSIFPYL